MERILEEWKKAGQGHVEEMLALARKEGAEETLKEELGCIQLDEVAAAYRCAVQQSSNAVAGDGELTTLANVQDRRGSPESTRQAWWELGVQAIRAGQVAALCLAGGQGSRLGSPTPKGMFDLGLESKRSLFELQALRLRRIAQLCQSPPIRWYLLTSHATDVVTRKFFEAHRYFGLEPSQVVFFEQPNLPALDAEGRVLFASASRLVMAPNGNGGLFDALANHSILQDLDRHGIRYLSQYCVDNVLVRPVDPYFVGYCVQNDVDCACKVVPKRDPTERVGVVCLRGGNLGVVEYSEISEEMAHRRDPHTGQLMFRDAHLCMNMFRADFLAAAVSARHDMPYHVAKRSVACVDAQGLPTSVVAYKLEKFIFDAFTHARHPGAFQVPRDEEFSPLKNAPGSCVLDSPDTCLNDLTALHRRWLLDAGALLADDAKVAPFDISPLVSFMGEGLAERFASKTLSGSDVLINP